MGFTANFYVFSKKENSTAIPTGTPSFSYSIVLTEECSIVNPIVIVRTDRTPTALNYCYIAGFGRYYFINNWVWKEGRWVAYMQCDVLASYRTQIASASLYFLRASTASDGNIQDMLYPAKKDPVITQIEQKEQWWYSGTFSYRTGYWVLGIVSKKGTTEYYCMDYTTFRKFCDKLLGTIDWANLNTQEISDSLTKALFNPFQYVVSCIWFPDVGSKSGWFVPSSIDFGWWSFDTEVGVFEPYEIPDNAYIERTIQLLFPVHPQSKERGEYLNKKPYRYCYLYINPWGVIEVDTDLMKSTYSEFNAVMRIDLISGTGICRVVGKSPDISKPQVVTQVSSQFGVPVQISDLNRNVGGVASGVVQMVSGAISGDFLGLASGIGNALTNNIPNIDASKGVNGSVVGVSYYPTCVTVCYEIVDEDNSDNGRPYCKNGTCKALGVGYYIAENGSILISGATKNELDSIKSYLEGGFYYA